MLIPGIFELLGKVIGPLITATSKSSIITNLLGSDGTVGGIMSAITGAVGQLEDAQVEELKVELQTLLAQQAENQAVDTSSESFYYKGWRPFLAWGLSICVVSHLAIAEINNIIFALGFTSISGLAPMDNMTLVLITSLLGIHMAARTVEKVNSNE